MRLQLRREGRRRHGARLQHDDRVHDVPALGVGPGDRGRLHHGGVRAERGLDLDRPDAVAGGDDHVVRTALEPELPVVVAIGAVARAPPAVLERRGLLPARCVEVAEEERRDARGAHQQLAALVQAQVDAVERIAERAGRRLVAAHDSGHGPDLGLAVAVPDAQSVQRPVELQHVGAEWLARRHDLAHAAQVSALELGGLGTQSELGGRHAEHRGP